MNINNELLKFQVWCLSDDTLSYELATSKVWNENEIEHCYTYFATIDSNRLPALHLQGIKPKLAELKSLFEEANPLPKVLQYTNEVVVKLPDFIRGYVECAFFTADPKPESGEYILDEDDWSDLSKLDKAHMIIDAQSFLEQYAFEIESVVGLSTAVSGRNYTEHQAGIDFYLSRNGHGSGFMDRGNEAIWKFLDNGAHEYGEANLHFICATPDPETCGGTGHCSYCDGREGAFTLE